MKSTEFEIQLSQEILNEYIKNRDNYSFTINLIKKKLIKEGSNLSQTEKESLIRYMEVTKSKKEKVQKVINALRKRMQSGKTYEYTDKATYKIIGCGDNSKVVDNLIYLQKVLESKIEASESNLQNHSIKSKTDLYNKFKSTYLNYRVNNLKNKLGVMQDHQREIIMTKVREVGRKNYGLVVHEIKNRLSTKQVIINGWNSVKAMLTQADLISEVSKTKTKVKS